MLKLYNTLSKQLEEIPKKDHLNLYTCGPTVYNYSHIGNLRSFIVADVLYRTLQADGYNPRWAMNVTDVDDKTIAGTIEKFGPAATPEHLRQFTEMFYKAFLKDLAEVNVLVKEIKFIRVTDVIPQIQEFILQLIEKGYAYTAEDGGTYFSIEKYQKDFGDYGQLVGEKFLEGKKVGARVKVDEYDKENLSDFALWKPWEAKDGQIFWQHPILGKGRPGWHIECSVVNKVAFGGEVTDIHTGGVDLQFPHHTNEIAQSQALLGKGNFVQHWFHSEHLLFNGKKMAKSANNFYVLEDIEDKATFANWALRYLFLQSHYRTQQNFTDASLDAAHNGVIGLINGIREHAPTEVTFNTASLEEDLNVPKALSENTHAAVLQNLLGIPLSGLEAEEQLPERVLELGKQRQAAKTEKDFEKSDEIRQQIEALGYEVRDTAEGQDIRKKM